MTALLYSVLSFHLCSMKTIIVCTDFSAAAEYAALYAVQLAKQMEASLLLVHVYQMPVTMTDFPVLMISAEDLKKNADAGLSGVKELVQKTESGLVIETESRLGDVGEEIEDLCARRKPSLLITGSKTMSGFERFIFGDSTLSIVKHCNCPVIAVPEKAALSLPKNIALAIDLLHKDEMAFDTITKIVNAFGAQLHVVHVETGEEEPAQRAEVMENLRNIKASYHAVRQDDVTEGIQHFVDAQAIDLLVVLPHRHNLYERLFFKGHTQGMIQALPIPVMCIRSEK